MIRSLHVRLLLTLMSVVVVALGTVALASSRSTAAAFQRYLERDLERNQQVFATLHDFFSQEQATRDLPLLARDMAQILNERFVLTDASGRVLADSRGALVGQQLASDAQLDAAIFIFGQPDLAAGMVPGEERQAVPMTAIPAEMVYGSVPVVGIEPADDVLGTVGMTPPLIARRADGRFRDPIGAAFIDAVNRSLLLAVGAAGLATLLLSWTFGRRILRPVATLTAAARKLEAGDLRQRVPVQGGDELGALGQAFNAMADSLARQETLRRNLVSDVAHELRTPLTNIRGYLEAVRDGVARPDERLMASLLEEAVLLNRLVDDLQELALAEAGQLRIERQPVALAAVAQHVARAMEPAIAARGVRLEINSAEPGPLVQGDAERLGQVLRNLLQNAATHTPAGGTIAVRVFAEGPEGVMQVQDTGSGIPAEQLPQIWERFVRADPARARATGGAGLGLAIVKQLVQAHGGSVSAASEPGAGATFTVRLPLDAASAA